MNLLLRNPHLNAAPGQAANLRPTINQVHELNAMSGSLSCVFFILCVCWAINMLNEPKSSIRTWLGFITLATVFACSCHCNIQHTRKLRYLRELQLPLDHEATQHNSSAT